MAENTNGQVVAAPWIEHLARSHACSRCAHRFTSMDLGAAVIRSHCRIWPVDSDRPHVRLTFDCPHCDACLSLDLDVTLQRMAEALATIYARQMRHYVPPLPLKLRG